MTAPAVRSAPAGTDATTLRLTSVLVAGLPAALGTPDAPKTYTVPAVFARQVSTGERAAIHSPDSTQWLAERGFPGVTLSVSDRRLLIGGTSLDQLRDGLAHELAVLLLTIDHDLTEQRDQRDADALVRLSAEADRSSEVKRIAEGIRFE